VRRSRYRDLNVERKRIVIISGASPSWAPRAPKEATALSEAGYEVCILGASGSRQQLETDLKLAADRGFAYEAADASILKGRESVAAAWAMKIRLKLARLLFSAAHIATAPLFSPWAKKLAWRAMDMQPRLAILHLEPGLRAGTELLRSRVPIALDMEDWYSEDLPLKARGGRPVAALRHLERMILLRSRYASCTTEAMADVLAAEYACPRPLRVYNVFPKPVLPDPVTLRDRTPEARSLAGSASRGKSVRSIHWFSQTLGPGRGLEELLAAAAGLGGELEIHLRGNVAAYQAWLEAAVPSALQSRVFVHATVADDDLPERIAEHDIGFAGELREIRSRDLTATNKIFQYLQSGLAVVASDTAGQQEVAAGARGAVRLYRSGSRTDLQQALREWLESPEKLAAAKAAARDVAAAEFHWEKEKIRLLDAVAAALD
jgi:glycosyltransferase involved in cell wall biosynthesis